ncbi:MAG: hypothetical protein JSS75_06550 [Bacteroidetes bacterium]|nr:hypothetical protein [Bacteroidota bacterium]
MRIVLVLTLVSTLTCTLAAQQRPNVDTLTLGGVKTSIPLNSAPQLAHFDTIFWSADMGAGMLRHPDNAFGHTGEYRVAIQDGKVQQITFAIGAHNKAEAKKFYDEVYARLTAAYGQPDGSSATEFRWEGVEQFFATRLSDDGNAVSIVLSKFEGR